MKILKTFCLGIYLITLTVNGNSQTLYQCVYSDSLGVDNFNEQISEIRESLKTKGLPNEVIESFIQRFYSNATSFLQVQSRIIYARPDSSFITLAYEPNKNSQYFQLATNKYMVTKGQLYRFDSANKEYILSRISDSSTSFNPTGKVKRILGYDCNEFKSDDELYTIWVTDLLPASINPGICVKNIHSAILGFEARINNAFTKSIASSINSYKKVI